MEHHHFSWENGPLIVDLPIKDGDFPSFFVKVYTISLAISPVRKV